MHRLVNKKATKTTEKEKIEERKAEVLARGRKFKYPLQYAKHKLVFNTIVISVIAVVSLLMLGGAMLYRWQNTGDVIYRITRVLPVSVATVDGERVRFFDYLMIYRSSMKPVEQQSGTLSDDAEGEAVRTTYKRAALTEAEELTYAYKLAKENDVTVSKEEIEEVFLQHKNMGGIERSEDTFLKIIEDNFAMTKSEYKRMIELSLYKKKVQEVVDENANKIASEVEKILKENGNNFEDCAKKLNGKVKYETTGGLTDAKNVDGGRANEANDMKNGEVKKFVSSNGDGYYFLKLIEKKDGKINYSSIKVEFTEFQKKFDEIKENIVEKIHL